MILWNGHRLYPKPFSPVHKALKFSQVLGVALFRFIKFDISNVNDMECMFNKCYKLKEIKGINIFNTNQVTNMKGMFQECNELEYLDLTNFDTSKASDMGFIFNKCHKLKEIKGIDKFNTNQVTNVSTMFKGCNELEYLDLSNFDTSNVMIWDLCLISVIN